MAEEKGASASPDFVGNNFPNQCNPPLMTFINLKFYFVFYFVLLRPFLKTIFHIAKSTLILCSFTVLLINTVNVEMMIKAVRARRGRESVRVFPTKFKI